MIRVFVPGYRNLPEILRCLTTLQRMAPPEGVEFTVLDDTDEAFFLDNGFDPHRGFMDVIPNALYCQRDIEPLGYVGKESQGFAANCNRALYTPFADSDILFFINQDVYDVPDPGVEWAPLLLSAFEDKHVGIVGVRLLFPDAAIQHAGIIFDGKCQPTHRFLGYRDGDYDLANAPEEVPAVTGAAMAVRASVFRQLDGFDAGAYPGGYFEDVDLCLRARALGYKVRYEPRIVWRHTAGTSGGGPNFSQNAATFKRRWVDTGLITPDTSAIRSDFW